MSFLRRPVVLMVLGFVVLAARRHRLRHPGHEEDRVQRRRCASSRPAGRRPIWRRPGASRGAYVAADPADPEPRGHRRHQRAPGLLRLPHHVQPGPGLDRRLLRPPRTGSPAAGSTVPPVATWPAAASPSAAGTGSTPCSAPPTSTTPSGRASWSPRRPTAARRSARRRWPSRPTGPDIGLGRPLLSVGRAPNGSDVVMLTAWTCHPVTQTNAGGTAVRRRRLLPLRRRRPDLHRRPSWSTTRPPARTPRSRRWTARASSTPRSSAGTPTGRSSCSWPSRPTAARPSPRACSTARSRSGCSTTRPRSSPTR